ncbi:hypothetical protein MIB92_19865 [Aestuariirhabdus sp. Z084]|uniref:hypothetical protein n=1 Tax=Aestuariirhabdus haliotis TaxID=2918751 RepID=UPI0020BE1F0D|nr:hypothetical protein [Aestuariirhabdus haliotis]MCL6417915.1 hypothetical protein [Aestuariirhabdus haliotis]
MLLDFLNTEHIFLSMSLIVALAMIVICCHEYFSIKQAERDLEEELKNPPDRIYQHNLKSFSDEASKP